jgi:hypothetical protein
LWRAVVSRPFDRECKLPVRGAINKDAGEFWVENPFDMPKEGKNLSAYENNRLFLNIDGQDFVDVSYGSLTDIDSDSRSVVCADFNRDGRQDLLIGNVGGGPLRLFLNECETDLAGNSLRVELQGVTSNRQAIGARMEATIGDRKLIRDVFFPNGCMGHGPPDTLLGLGDATQVDSLKIRWPDGRWTEHGAIPAGRYVRIREDQPAVTDIGPVRAL